MGLDFAVVGETTDDLRFRVFHRGELEADLPIKKLGDDAPQYDRPHTHRPPPKPLALSEVPPPNDYGNALLRLLGSPDLSSRRWVWEQYDHLVGGDTMQRPGGDAAVVRVGESGKALAFTLDVTPRYCAADPFEGGKQAVAESWRNLTAVGAEPLAITDNLNFGNPEKPEIMGEFVDAIRGIGEACRALAYPVVSGNVSLYNETNGVGIPPTPAIGGVGLMPDHTAMATVGFKADGELILLVGAGHAALGQSLYLREILGREEGAPPPVDLAAEKRNGDFVRAAIRARQVTAVHDLSDGGLLVALAEMAMAGNRGASVKAPIADAETHAWLFAEDQARYLLTAPATALPSLEAVAAKAGVPLAAIGRVGGEDLVVEGKLGISVAKLREAHEYWFPAYMAGAA